MDLFQDQPMFKCLIESHDVNDILLFVKGIGNLLLDSMDLHIFAHEWKVVMEVVKTAVIEYGSLWDIALTPLLSQLTDVKLF